MRLTLDTNTVTLLTPHRTAGCQCRPGRGFAGHKAAAVTIGLYKLPHVAVMHCTTCYTSVTYSPTQAHSGGTSVIISSQHGAVVPMRHQHCHNGCEVHHWWATRVSSGPDDIGVNMFLGRTGLPAQLATVCLQPQQLALLGSKRAWFQKKTKKPAPPCARGPIDQLTADQHGRIPSAAGQPPP